VDPGASRAGNYKIKPLQSREEYNRRYRNTARPLNHGACGRGSFAPMSSPSDVSRNESSEPKKGEGGGTTPTCRDPIMEGPGADSEENPRKERKKASLRKKGKRGERKKGGREGASGRVLLFRNRHLVPSIMDRVRGEQSLTRTGREGGEREKKKAIGKKKKKGKKKKGKGRGGKVTPWV